MQMVAEAAAAVPSVSPAEARRRLQQEPRVLLVDVRDAEAIRASGKIEEAVPISAGTLLFKADQEVPQEWRDERLQDRTRPIICQCDLGPLSAISAKNLKDMGFNDVSFIEGGIAAWKQAGFPTDSFPG